MAGFNSVGKFSLSTIYKAVAGSLIKSQQHNIPMEDIEAALSMTVVRDGRAAMTGDLKMGGKKITGLAVGSQPTDGVNLTQLASKIDTTEAAVSGTVNDIILTPTSPISAYPASFMVTWANIGANTSGTAYLRLSSLAQISLTDNGKDDLNIGATGPAGYICRAYYNGTKFVLLNPYGSAAFTPQLWGTAQVAGVTSSGHYIVNGGMVTVFGSISTTYAAMSAAGGLLQIRNLPFSLRDSQLPHMLGLSVTSWGSSALTGAVSPYCLMTSGSGPIASVLINLVNTNQAALSSSAFNGAASPVIFMFNGSYPI